jgi:hypothetical protein
MFKRVETMLVTEQNLQRDKHRQQPQRHRQHHACFVHRSSLADQIGGDSDDNEAGGDEEADDRMPQAVGEGRAEDDLEPILGKEPPVHDLVAGRRLHPAVGRQDPERRK